MSELEVLDAPIAKLNEDWGEFGDFQQFDGGKGEPDEAGYGRGGADVSDGNLNRKLDADHTSMSIATTTDGLDNLSNRASNNDDASFVEMSLMSGSLEDLVNTFDEKITNCFRDFDEQVADLAPVQVRSQEEILNDCQIWWTLTGTFGNILPIDWAKTHARQRQLPTLNLNTAAINLRQNSHNGSGITDNGLILDGQNDDEEDIAKDLDLHSLILNSLQQEPIFTAEQVLEEIDEIMQEEMSDAAMMSISSTTNGDETPLSEVQTPAAYETKSCGISSLLYEEKLRNLSNGQLNELLIELERMIQDHSETLIQELALRDELEFEKELKNTFISLLLSVQNKRRQHHIDKKKGKASGTASEAKYLTTVIPYNEGETPNVRTIQILIKILKAINEDSSNTPTLLTDYILKVLCPT